MTERGPFTGMRGAPGPAEPSNTGDPPATATGPHQIPGLTADLGAVRRTDAIIDSLAARRAAGTAARSATAAEGTADEGATGATGTTSTTGTTGGPAGGRQRQADEPDPAVRLLRALITDVDEQAPEADIGTTPAPPSPPAPGSGPRRRGPRTIVALGVAGAVLASTGVAAAGDGVSDRSAAAPAPASTGVSGDVENPKGTDSEAGFHDDWRAMSVPVPGVPAPVRVVPVVPEPERPAARRPPADRREYDPIRTRPRHLYPHRTPPPSKDAPVVSEYSPAPRDEDEPSSPPSSGTPDTGRPPSGDLGESPKTGPDGYQYQDRRHHEHDRHDRPRRG